VASTSFPSLLAVSPPWTGSRRPDAVIDRAPHIGSWCGKIFSQEKIATRPGFDAIPAVRNRRLYEIESALILQSGPAALTDALAAVEKIIQGVP
jgi:iron complex transport system substrate-binding protein